MEVWPWSLENPEAGFYSAWAPTVPPENATGDLKAFYDSAVNRVSDVTGASLDDFLDQSMKSGFGPSQLPRPAKF